MPYSKNTTYVDIPFSSETASGDFYTYASLKDLAQRCESNQEEVNRCRTIGILQSLHGRFYLTEVDHESKMDTLIQLSVVFLKSPLPSVVIPYPIQVFGTLQWKKRPVIFAKLVQVLNISMALRLNNTMSSVSKMYLARNVHEYSQENKMYDESTQECDKYS